MDAMRALTTHGTQQRSRCPSPETHGRGRASIRGENRRLWKENRGEIDSSPRFRAVDPIFAGRTASDGAWSLLTQQ